MKRAIYGRRNFSGSSRVTVITRRVKKSRTLLKRMWEKSDEVVETPNLTVISDANVAVEAATG